jgi:hypothetical protein
MPGTIAGDQPVSYRKTLGNEMEKVPICDPHEIVVGHPRAGAKAVLDDAAKQILLRAKVREASGLPVPHGGFLVHHG